MIAIPDPIKVRKDVPSGTIIINRAENRNALARDVVAKLQQAFEDFQAEKSVRAVILTGSGTCFSSGTDLRELSDSLGEAGANEQWQRDVDQFLTLLETMLRFPKPIIAALAGDAIGSGAALMLAADLVVASEGATISFPEPQRGLVAGLAAPLLAFRVGAGQAARLMLSPAKVTSSQCQSLGLFHELVASDLVWARSHEIAKEVATGSHQSILLSKQMINETIGEQLFTQLSIGAANTASARTTDAAAEGIKAFLEKRKAEF